MEVPESGTEAKAVAADGDHVRREDRWIMIAAGGRLAGPGVCEGRCRDPTKSRWGKTLRNWTRLSAFESYDHKERVVSNFDGYWMKVA